MKTKIMIIAIIMGKLSFAGCNVQDKKEKCKYFPVLKGFYLGQEPPGIIPEIFARGIISADNPGKPGCVFSTIIGD